MSVEKLQKKIERLEKVNATLEKQVEDLSREAYEQFREVQEVYDALGQSIILINEYGNILQKNIHANNHLVEDGIDNIFQLIKDEQSTNTILELLKKQTSSERDFQAKIYQFTNDSTLPFICSLKVLEGHSGEKFVFVANEITSIKEEELKRAELQNQLIQQSFTEGMAETAISILHNIGNVLTGMIGHIETPHEGPNLKATAQNYGQFFQQLNKLNEEKKLMDFLSSEENNKKLFSFMATINEELGLIQNQHQTLLNQIKEKAHHIGSIISTQQQYAKLKKGITSTVTVGQVLDDCLLINESKISKSYIKLEREWDSSLSFGIEKNGFIQVLSNTLVNAIEAVEMRIKNDNEYIKGVITIATEVNDDQLSLKIKDDALGFSKETAEKLFKFGFSTKKRSSGFGLHNCQNFMNNQGGKYHISSDGEGLGATVTIEIPLTSSSSDA